MAEDKPFQSPAFVGCRRWYPGTTLPRHRHLYLFLLPLPDPTTIHPPQIHPCDHPRRSLPFFLPYPGSFHLVRSTPSRRGGCGVLYRPPSHSKPALRPLFPAPVPSFAIPFVPQLRRHFFWPTLPFFFVSTSFHSLPCPPACPLPLTLSLPHPLPALPLLSPPPASVHIFRLHFLLLNFPSSPTPLLSSFHLPPTRPTIPPAPSPCSPVALRTRFTLKYFCHPLIAFQFSCAHYTLFVIVPPSPHFIYDTSRTLSLLSHYSPLPLPC
ncbi:hypothetical protein C8F04DRAFT_109586 [Mycena alexandri]|uniref:Uncharacterized protein n=1 Tax=Mycena alexandri TaxID=1745969 RepID=A0AAD6SFP8_9AGAR|nr:hypothetical protein C8F04DRAFT_109586 [Mycena alexandri]